MANLNGVHHVAYRCKNAKQTVEWYQKYLDARFILAIAENEVPSTRAGPVHAHLHRHRRRQHPGLFRAAHQGRHDRALGRQHPRGRSTWR
jgi:catechol 2,3-dioxygenase-like lactoylglutathione lyase family enzyme